MANIIPFKKPVQGCTITLLPDGNCRVLVDITLSPTDAILIVSAMGLVNVPVLPSDPGLPNT
jgi:hypothetical protein